MLSLLANIILAAMCIYLYQAGKKDRFTKLLNKVQFNKDASNIKRKDDVIIIIDIDKFKQINDTKGHAFGDRVIEDVSNTIRQGLRRSDRAYRIGGDEFAIITNCAAIIQRLKFNVAVSIGIGNSYEQADKNMYNKKHGNVWQGVF
jgi:diguanylate cyclase (GGDEF)-like protein